MNEWMDGWMDEWMDGWMNGWMDGWMNEWMDGWMDEWMDEHLTPVSLRFPPPTVWDAQLRCNVEPCSRAPLWDNVRCFIFLGIHSLLSSPLVCVASHSPVCHTRLRQI